MEPCPQDWPKCSNYPIKAHCIGPFVWQRGYRSKRGPSVTSKWLIRSAKSIEGPDRPIPDTDARGSRETAGLHLRYENRIFAWKVWFSLLSFSYTLTLRMRVEEELICYILNVQFITYRLAYSHRHSHFSSSNMDWGLAVIKGNIIWMERWIPLNGVPLTKEMPRLMHSKMHSITLDYTKFHLITLNYT